MNVMLVLCTLCLCLWQFVAYPLLLMGGYFLGKWVCRNES